MQKYVCRFLLFISLFVVSSSILATKLVYVKVVDKDHILVFFKDGEVTYTDNNTTCPYSNCVAAADNTLVTYGTALNTTNAAVITNWTIKCADDANYGAAGKNPTNVYRKSKLNGMAQKNWNTSTNDFDYDWAYEHILFLKLPFSMVQGRTYTVEVNSNTNTDVTSKTLTFDIYNSKTEAIKVNLVGYFNTESVKAADLYMWLGDGGARNYSSFLGNKVYIYDINTQTSQEVGTVAFWKTKSAEFSDNHKMIESDVWKVDFTGFKTPGTYRLVVEGVGCSENFVIGGNVYKDPFKISTLGFYYMRIGEPVGSITPVPRQPQYIPGVSPANCKVYITTMHPYHTNWGTFCSGDKWDCKDQWASYSTGRENPNAKGGHSDALDWDRHLGHVSIIYDMLLPYYISKGKIGDDDIGIRESGNGIPDILDEARNEVDFWLSLRDGKGYSHGINNPNSTNVFYQAANTGVAAWANAANAAMLASCFKISGHTALMQQYRDSAIAAYNYASSLSTADQMLTNSQNIGAGSMRGRDFKMTAAAFLYDLTGAAAYETFINTESTCTGTNSAIWSSSFNQIYATAGYLFTTRTKNYPTLFNNMKASVINQAKIVEANYSLTRPSRRSTNNTTSWFHTELATQHSIIAHAIADAGSDKNFLLDALILEADWSLGRNPLNMIQMTTATTTLANKRSVENAYTSGWNDGVPGVHPGHTPFMNIYDWGGTMIMGKPSWMTNKNYPAATNWPYGEMYYNVRYVYAANEFTPQQTMRGKQALYGYLYSLSSNCPSPNLGNNASICGQSSMVLNTGLNAAGKTFKWYKDNVSVDGQTGSTLTITSAGTYKVEVDSAFCKTSDEIVISGSLLVDLGADKDLCNPAEYTLDAGNASVPNISYLWNTGATTRTITVNKAGTYSVTVSATGCAAQTDAVTITSQLLDVKADTICSPGQLIMQVNGSGTYNWYDVPVNGTILATGATYNPIVNANKTFYVEDAGGVNGTLGKFEKGIGSSWSQGTGYFTETDKIYKVSVLQPLTLKSIDVYVNTANASVTINLKQSSTVVHTKTVTGLALGKQTILLNFNVAPGEYIIDAGGTTGSLNFEASGGTFPYSYPGYISFTFNESWQSSWYGLFYNWVITTSSPCLRTPVYGVIDATHPNCVTKTTQASSDNHFAVYPNPAKTEINIQKSASDRDAKKKVDITNALGQNVYSTEYLLTTDYLTIDISYLPPALYFIKVGNEVQKFIKQ